MWHWFKSCCELSGCDNLDIILKGLICLPVLPPRLSASGTGSVTRVMQPGTEWMVVQVGTRTSWRITLVILKGLAKITQQMNEGCCQERNCWFSTWQSFDLVIASFLKCFSPAFVCLWLLETDLCLLTVVTDPCRKTRGPFSLSGILRAPWAETCHLTIPYLHQGSCHFFKYFLLTSPHSPFNFRLKITASRKLMCELTSRNYGLAS